MGHHEARNPGSQAIWHQIPDPGCMSHASKYVCVCGCFCVAQVHPFFHMSGVDINSVPGTGSPKSQRCWLESLPAKMQEGVIYRAYMRMAFGSRHSYFHFSKAFLFSNYHWGIGVSYPPKSRQTSGGLNSVGDLIDRAGGGVVNAWQGQRHMK